MQDAVAEESPVPVAADSPGQLVRRALAYAVTLLIAAAFLAYAYQRSIIYTATHFETEVMTPADMDLPFEPVALSVGEDTTIAWYVEHPRARGTILFSHDFYGNIADRLDTVRMFLRLGCSVLAYDYGGYGNSTGEPSEERLHADIDAAWDWLVHEKGLGPESIVLFGRGLGGGPTAYWATQVAPGAVVLESTFRSLPALAREQAAWLPLGAFLWDRFPIEEYVKEIDAPILVIHSPDDEFVPFEHGRAIFDAANPPKAFFELAGGEDAKRTGQHYNAYILFEEHYLIGIDDFLEPLFGPIQFYEHNYLDPNAV